MNQTSPLDAQRQVIEKLLSEGKSIRQVAEQIPGTSERSVRRALRRWGHAQASQSSKFERAGFRLDGDEADITTPPSPTLNDTDSLMRERGLDPEEWEISSLIVNEWDSPTGETLKQLKLHCKRKKPISMIAPARISLGKVFANTLAIDPELSTEPEELVVFVGDQHAPNHDKELHRRFCEFLADYEPQRGVLMGDLIDLPKDSRHPSDPDWDEETQTCLDEGAQILLDYREASPDTYWVKLPGNHLERLRRVIIDRLGHWYGLRPAQVESLPDLPPIHDPVHLLRLDEIGVEFIRPKGSYQHAQYQVAPDLVARHGDIAKRGSGASAAASLASLDYSFIQGHTHRQALVQKMIHTVNGQKLLHGAETGCMCDIRGGLGYAPRPDWGQGFCTATVYDDGGFKLDLATYQNHKLYFRDMRY